MEAVAYKRYRVVSDSEGFFKPGEIVVSLENDIAPFCVREKDYLGPEYTFKHYEPDKYHALGFEEIVAIE